MGDLAIRALFPAILIFWRRLWRSPEIPIGQIHHYFGVEGLVLALRFLPDRAMVPCLRMAGATVGEKVVVHGPIYIVNFQNRLNNLEIADGVHIGSGVLIDLANRITIKANSTISMGVTLLSHQDLGNARPAGENWQRNDDNLLISNQSFVGANATILGGKNLGHRCLVASGAVVAQNVSDDIMVGGVPARTIASRKG